MYFRVNNKILTIFHLVNHQKTFLNYLTYKFRAGKLYEMLQRLKKDNNKENLF